MFISQRMFGIRTIEQDIVSDLYFQIVYVIACLDELRKDELMSAVLNSDKRYEEIISFIQGKDVE